MDNDVQQEHWFFFVGKTTVYVMVVAIGLLFFQSSCNIYTKGSPGPDGAHGHITNPGMPDAVKEGRSFRMFAGKSDHGALRPSTGIAIPQRSPAQLNKAPQLQAAANITRIPSPPRYPYHHIIVEAAEKYQLDPALIRAVIMAESNNYPRAVSKRGARGLMQLMPVTAESLGVKDSFDPMDNIHGGTKYLRNLLDRFDQDLKLALAAYNAGSTYVRKYKGVPPFNATKRYISTVMKYHHQYRVGS